MRDAVTITLKNSRTGLVLPPDLQYYATDSLEKFFDAVTAMHETQLTAASYDRFRDSVLDHYADDSLRSSVPARQLMVCYALTYTHSAMRRWVETAVQTAISIYLRTINQPDDSLFPRIIPHALDAMRIEKPWNINHEVIRRILYTDPWLSFGEAMRGQHQRIAQMMLPRYEIEKLPELINQAYDAMPELFIKKKVPDDKRRVRRSINRAVRLHNRLFGRANLRTLFSSAKPLVLDGKRYRYMLSVDPGDLHRFTKDVNTGTTPIHTWVLRKGGDPDKNDDLLQTMCLYHRDTPIIDHLIAFTLNLKTESGEMDVLRDAQAQHLSNAFYHDPVLPELKGLHDPVLAPDTTISNIVLNSNHDSQFETLRCLVKIDFQPFVTEIMGYSAPLINALRATSQFFEFEFYNGDEAAAKAMGEVIRCFRNQ